MLAAERIVDPYHLVCLDPSERSGSLLLVKTAFALIFCVFCTFVFDALRWSTQWQDSRHAPHCRSVSSSCLRWFRFDIDVIKFAMVVAK